MKAVGYGDNTRNFIGSFRDFGPYDNKQKRNFYWFLQGFWTLRQYERVITKSLAEEPTTAGTFFGVVGVRNQRSTTFSSCNVGSTDWPRHIISTYKKGKYKNLKHKWKCSQALSLLLLIIKRKTFISKCMQWTYKSKSYSYILHSKMWHLNHSIYDSRKMHSLRMKGNWTEPPSVAPLNYFWIDGIGF